MSTHPIGDKILVELEKPSEKIGRFFLAEHDFIRFCERCHRMGDALDQPCSGEDEFRLNPRRDTLEYVGTDTTHRIESVQRPSGYGRTRIGTVLATGPRVREIKRGDCIMIGLVAGGTLNDVRLVREREVLAWVER